MSADIDPDIPGTGAVFTFGKSKFADNVPSHFFIKNDPIVDISCGDQHTAVVCQNGRVFTFGSNEWGQLGLGHNNPIYKPSCLKSIKTIKCTNVALGRAHTLIRTGEGELYTCGANSEGQLGLGDTEPKSSPQLVTSLHSVTSVVAGSNHSAALTCSGEVFVWGSNGEGQLGLGESTGSYVLPTKLNLSDIVVSISAGYYHTLCLTDNGSVWSFGEGEGGRLGLGHEESIYIPSKITTTKSIKAISAGGSHSLALDASDKLLVWGSNDLGQLGLETETCVLEPTPCLADKTFQSISAGQQHSAFVTDGGTVLMCGDSHHGKLGIEWSSDKYISKPLTIPKLTSCNVIKVSCGGCHTAILAAPRTQPVCQIFIENADSIQSITGTKTLPPLIKKISDPALLNPPEHVASPPMNHIPPASIKQVNVEPISSDTQDGSSESELEEESMKTNNKVISQAWQREDEEIQNNIDKKNNINSQLNNQHKKVGGEGKISRFFSRLRKTSPSNTQDITTENKDMSNLIISHQDNNTQTKKSKMCSIL